MKLNDYLGYKIKMPKIRSEEHALDIAIKHWEQNSSLTCPQMLKLNDKLESSVIHGTWCALCTWHTATCNSCIVHMNGQLCSNGNSMYDRTMWAFYNFMEYQTAATFKLWKKAARNMYEFLLILKTKGEIV